MVCVRGFFAVKCHSIKCLADTYLAGYAITRVHLPDVFVDFYFNFFFYFHSIVFNKECVHQLLPHPTTTARQRLDGADERKQNTDGAFVVQSDWFKEPMSV